MNLLKIEKALYKYEDRENILIKDITKKWFRYHTIIEAQEEAMAIFGTLFGDKVFWMNEGERVKVKQFSEPLWFEGDKCRLKDIITMNSQDNFKWTWIEDFAMDVQIEQKLKEYV